MPYLITLTIWSMLDGKASGSIKVTVPSNLKVGSLLKLFCNEKELEVTKSYILLGRSNQTLKPSKTLSDVGILDGDIITLSQSEKYQQPYSFGPWKIIAGFALLVGLVGLSYSLAAYFLPMLSSPPENTQKGDIKEEPNFPHRILKSKYGLVIDAGSSHSKLFVFSWMKDKDSTEDIELMHNCHMDGGVAHFRHHIEDLKDYFVPCLTEAENLVPESFKSKTPLILAATAGMRMLRATDPAGSSLVLSSIREVFTNHSNFSTRHNDVFIASGQQEGINGWAALNYLMETFQEPDNDDAASALDVGGASVQVTTQMNRTHQWPTVNITIFKNTYSLYSKSFMCYGITEALHRFEFYLAFKELLKTSSNKTIVLANPCLAKGQTSAILLSDFTDPCVSSHLYMYNASTIHSQSLRSKQNRYESKYGSKRIRRDNENSLQMSPLDSFPPKLSSVNETTILLHGTSNMTECQAGVQQLFDYELCKKTFIIGDCFNKKIVPPYNGELVGFSSIFLVLLPLLDISPSSSLEEFHAAVLETCSMSITELRNRHPEVDNITLSDLCFDSMYIYSLLTEGLGITPELWKSILFTDKVKKQDVVWAMGLMLNRTSHFTIRSGEERSNYDLLKLIFLVSLFTGFVVFSLIFIVIITKIKNRNNMYNRYSHLGE